MSYFVCRSKVNYPAPSKLIVFSNIDGLVDQLICLRKWHGRLWGPRLEFGFLWKTIMHLRLIKIFKPNPIFHQISSYCLLQKVPLKKKFFLIYNFFFARRITSHIVTFFFYCIIIPLSVFFPEISIPRWGVVYIPTAITLLNSVGTPRLGICTLIVISFSLNSSKKRVFKGGFLYWVILSKYFLSSLQLHSSYCLLDLIWECHVVAPMQSCLYRSYRGGEGKWMDCHWEIGRHAENKTKC